MNDELIDELIAAQGEYGYWYMASPYTKHAGGYEVANFEACLAASLLIDKGVRIFCPIAHSHAIANVGIIEKGDSRTWLAQDYPLMIAATGLLVVMIDGYEDSHGIAVEVETFKEQDKQIHYLPWPLVESEVE